MAKTWRQFIRGLRDDLGILAKEELIDFINETKVDSNAFIRRQGEKLELYLTQLATKKITRKQFQGYILDIRDLTKMQARKMRVRAKARAQRLVKNIQTLILNTLLDLLPK